MMHRSVRYLILALLLTWLSACSVMPYQGSGFHAGYVQVRKGETLYAIAWRFDLDYHEVARWNGLSAPYTLTPGQWIRMNPPGQNQQLARAAPPQARPQSSAVPSPGEARPYRPASPPPASPIGRSRPAEAAAPSRLHWLWPTQGRLLQAYSKTEQGIEIGGRLGQPVIAAAAGQVVYSGNGLPSYGNLIIIKHNGHYLSAYGHNQKLLVKEGDVVKQGQKIALMGETGTGITQPMLFFEIRVDGDPVNPITYLPGRAK